MFFNFLFIKNNFLFIKNQVIYADQDIFEMKSTKEDIELINSHYVGQNRIEMQDISVDDDVSYTCSTNFFDLPL